MQSYPSSCALSQGTARSKTRSRKELNCVLVLSTCTSPSKTTSHTLFAENLSGYPQRSMKTKLAQLHTTIIVIKHICLFLLCSLCYCRRVGGTGIFYLGLCFWIFFAWFVGWLEVWDFWGFFKLVFFQNYFEKFQKSGSLETLKPFWHLGSVNAGKFV